MQNLFEQKLVRMLTQAYSPLSESESSIISGRNSNDGLRPSLVWPGPLALKSLVFNMNWVSVFWLSLMFSNCRKSWVSANRRYKKRNFKTDSFGSFNLMNEFSFVDPAEPPAITDVLGNRFRCPSTIADIKLAFDPERQTCCHWQIFPFLYVSDCL